MYGKSDASGIERSTQGLLNRSEARNERFRHRLQRVQPRSYGLDVDHRLKITKAAFRENQRFESSQGLDKLAVFRVQHRDLKPRQAGEFIRLVSKTCDLI